MRLLCNNHRRGFTLTETILVLIVVAIVLTGLFFAWANLEDSSQATQANQDLSILSGNIRRLYQNSHKISNTAAFTDANMFKAGVVPVHIMDSSGTAMVTPWGTPITLAATSTTQFEVRYTGLEETPCRQLVSFASGTSHLDSLVQIDASGSVFDEAAIRSLRGSENSLSGCTYVYFRFNLR